jgi:hypothetical protein
MTITRDSAVHVVSELLGGRPARWLTAPVADYDGHERTLEVFDADAGEQLELLRRLRTVRPELSAAVGGPLVVVFHTRAESARLHGDLLKSWPRASYLGVDVDVQLGQVLPPRKRAA